MLPSVAKEAAHGASSLCRNQAVIPKVTASVTGAASHTPVIPNQDGRTKMQIKRITSPLEKEIAADSKALPVAVK